MPIVEVGGRKTGCRPTRLPSHTICIDATRLPNPFNAIRDGEIEESMIAVTEWLRLKRRKAFDTLVEDSVVHLLRGCDIRIVCYGGRHRSQAVANAVVNRLSEQLTVTLRVLESPRLM